MADKDDEREDAKPQMNGNDKHNKTSRKGNEDIDDDILYAKCRTNKDREELKIMTTIQIKPAVGWIRMGWLSREVPTRLQKQRRYTFPHEVYRAHPVLQSRRIDNEDDRLRKFEIESKEEARPAIALLEIRKKVWAGNEDMPLTRQGENNNILRK